MKAKHVFFAATIVAFLLTAVFVEARDLPKPNAGAHDPVISGGGSSQAAPEDTKVAIEAVDHFSAALKAGDFETVEALLDPEVLILESGSAERNRQEYLSHHAMSDAKFLKDAHVQVLRRTAKRSGDVVWVGSESEIHSRMEGKPVTLLSTETVVLKNVNGSWRIVHLHWSSRPKK